MESKGQKTLLKCHKEKVVKHAKYSFSKPKSIIQQQIRSVQLIKNRMDNFHLQTYFVLQSNILLWYISTQKKKKCETINTTFPSFLRWWLFCRVLDNHLDQWFLNLGERQNHLAGLLKQQYGTPQSFWFSKLVWGPISNQFQYIPI